jgi:cobalt/nickel transport system ATP-binding protein
MIRVEGVTHSYRDGGVVLDDVTFEIGSGEKVVLLGSNGCGKTTLLRIIDGLVFPASGTVEVDGNSVTRRSLKRAPLRDRFRRDVVLLFQNPEAMVFNPTVLDEIAYGLRQAGADDADDRARHWASEFGIVRHLDRPAFQLSRGEIQKVCLASLLALEPRVLLLDEPTASLDPRSTGWLIDLLQDLGQTMLVTTHNLSMASELGDRTIVLSEEHRVVYDGAVSELMGDTERLIEANLVHVHRHRHGDVEHRHYHTHEWD